MTGPERIFSRGGGQTKSAGFSGIHSWFQYGVLLTHVFSLAYFCSITNTLYTAWATYLGLF